MAALAAVLADLSGNLSFFGISRPLNFRVFGRKTTLFQIAAIRPGGQHFVFPFRELNAAPYTPLYFLCTPVHACHRRVTKWCVALDVLRQKVKTSNAPRPIPRRRARFHGR